MTVFLRIEIYGEHDMGAQRRYHCAELINRRRRTDYAVLCCIITQP